MDRQLHALYRSRRERLGALIGENAIAIIPAETFVTRGGRDFPFAQDKNFLYLTGLNEPDACLVVMNTEEGVQSVLFCPSRDVENELWHGPHLIPEDAVSVLGVDDAFPNTPKVIERAWVTRYLRFPERVYYPHKRSAADDCLKRYLQPLQRIARYEKTKCRFLDSGPLLADMRLVKDEHEIATMRRAARISAEAHQGMLSILRPDMTEAVLEAEIASRFRRAGGSALHAYQPIVAGGKNACVLHYVSNSDRLRDGDLVLIDAGCELDGYASDITRTYPVNGRYSPAQREIYDIVLAAQEEAIAEVRPGVNFGYIQDISEMRICEGLRACGIITCAGTLEAAFQKKAHGTFFPHRIGHWIGLDVHDTDPSDHLKDDGGRRKEYRERPFVPGMVITVEPGIYIRPHVDVPPKYWNVGVRIEDDVLVTAAGHDVLSVGAAKKADEVEGIMDLVKYD